MTRKRRFLTIGKNLLILYLVHSFLDLVWPDSDMKNVSTKFILLKNLARAIGSGAVYLGYELYSSLKRDDTKL